jgi:hypothetical protein
MSVFTLFDSVLSAQNLSDEVKQYALGFPVRPTPRDEYPTTGVLAAPNHVGPWSTWAGSHSWLDDGSNRYLKETVNDHFASLLSYQAYGAWYFRCWREDSSTYISLPFMVQKPDLRYNNAGQDGYFVLIGTGGRLRFLEITAGALTTVYDSNPVNPLASSGQIELFTTRNRSDDSFSIYARDTLNPLWILMDSSIDTTHTTSRYIQFYTINAAKEIRIYDDILFFPYGDTLTPNDIPIIAD